MTEPRPPHDNGEFPRWHPFHYAPHRLFLWLALGIGGIFIIAIPPMAFLDEMPHTLRVIELAQGRWDSHAEVPDRIKSFIDYWVQRDVAHRTGNPYQDEYNFPYVFAEWLSPLPEAQPGNNIVLLQRGRASIYFLAPYLPAIPIAWIGLHTPMPPWLLFLLMRAGIFLTGTGLLYAAIRMIPVLKWHYFLMALFPVNLYIRSTVSADPLTIGYGFLFIALVLESKTQESTISNRRVALLSLLSFLLCQCKSAYFLLPGAIMLLPARRYASLTQHVACLCGVMVMPFFSGILLLLSAREVSLHLPFLNQPSVDAQGQVLHIMHHPLLFLHTLWSTWSNEFSSFTADIFGFGSLGVFAVREQLPYCFAYLELGLLLSLPGGDAPALSHFTTRDRLLSLLPGIGTLLLVSIIFYAFTSPIRGHYIYWMQGRYFLLSLPLLLIATLHSYRNRERYAWLVAAMIIFLLEAIIWSGWLIYYHYYQAP